MRIDRAAYDLDPLSQVPVTPVAKLDPKIRTTTPQLPGEVTNHSMVPIDRVGKSIARFAGTGGEQPGASAYPTSQR